MISSHVSLFLQLIHNRVSYHYICSFCQSLDYVCDEVAIMLALFPHANAVLQCLTLVYIVVAVDADNAEKWFDYLLEFILLFVELCLRGFTVEFEGLH